MWRFWGSVGGSLARALRRAGACGTIIGFGRNESNLKKAVELGVIDDYSLQAAAAVKDADMIVLATPLSTIDVLFSELRGAINTDATITDAGSAKGSVIRAAATNLDAD